MARKTNPLSARIRRNIKKLEQPPLPRPRIRQRTFRLNRREERMEWEELVNSPHRFTVVSHASKVRYRGKELVEVVSVTYECLEDVIDTPESTPASEVNKPSQSREPVRPMFDGKLPPRVTDPERPLSYYEFTKRQREQEKGS